MEWLRPAGGRRFQHHVCSDHHARRKRERNRRGSLFRLDVSSSPRCPRRPSDRRLTKRCASEGAGAVHGRASCRGAGCTRFGRRRPYCRGTGGSRFKSGWRRGWITSCPALGSAMVGASRWILIVLASRGAIELRVLHPGQERSPDSLRSYRRRGWGLSRRDGLCIFAAFTIVRLEADWQSNQDFHPTHGEGGLSRLSGRSCEERALRAGYDRACTAGQSNCVLHPTGRSLDCAYAHTGEGGIRTHGKLALQRFSRPPQSTTLPPLLVGALARWVFNTASSGGFKHFARGSLLAGRCRTWQSNPRGSLRPGSFQDRGNRPICRAPKTTLTPHGDRAPWLQWFSYSDSMSRAFALFFARRPDTAPFLASFPMRILISPDKFKGSLPAGAVAAAIRAGFARVFPEAQFDLAPIADGGEGTAEIFCEALGGRKSRRLRMTRWGGRWRLLTFVSRSGGWRWWK